MIKKVLILTLGALSFCVVTNQPRELQAQTPPLEHVVLKIVATGLVQPVGIFAQPGSPSRLFVVEQGGKVQLIENGVRAEEPFLDLSAIVNSGGEKGLLGLAFHPQFEKNGKFYVNYTAQDTRLYTVVAEYLVDPVTTKVKLGRERRILTVDQPYANHNGGNIIFGPDGKLYIGMGDGGSANDPHGHGQNRNTLLGALLRIDVDGDPYTIPPDNPFADGKAGRPEIWAYGLRNPWRFSFDQKTGELWLADVGQDKIEEIDIIKRGGNYGWNIFEGTHCLRFRLECVSGTFEDPIFEYDHDAGRSVTGGFVYRGQEFPEFYGVYFYGDYVSGRIWGLKYEDRRLLWNKELLKTELNISSFGVSLDGEIFVVSHRSGEIYKMVRRAM